MSDLIDFLRARYDAREREVRDRHRRTCGHDEVGADWPCNCDDHVSFSLTEVDSKRRILDLHTGVHDCPEMRTGVYPADWPAAAAYGKPGEHWAYPSTEHFDADEFCPTLRLLALPYSDHEGFDEAWKP